MRLAAALVFAVVAAHHHHHHRHHHRHHAAPAAGASAPAPADALPSASPGGVVGCSDFTRGRCVGFWWRVHGGPAVYDLRTGRPVPGYVYIDDTTPCNPHEPYPMNTISAPVGSATCERAWVKYYRPKARVLWAAAAGPMTFTGADATLVEWYPAYGRSLTVPCGGDPPWGYIVQRYFDGSGVATRPYAGFKALWGSAERCGGDRVLAWY